MKSVCVNACYLFSRLLIKKCPPYLHYPVDSSCVFHHALFNDCATCVSGMHVLLLCPLELSWLFLTLCT